MAPIDFKSQQLKDTAGVIACLLAATYHIQIILSLKQHGIHANATVVAIKRGARNSSWAVYRFPLSNAQETIAQDVFQQYIKQVDKDDSIQVIYDKNDPKTVTADLGLWIWQAPAIFLSGFLMLAILAFFIWRKRSP